MKKYFLIIWFIAFSFIISNAQIEKNVKWTFSTKKITETEIELIFKATINEKWHLYSSHNPPGGARALEIFYDESDKFELIGIISETPKPKEVYDDIFEKIYAIMNEVNPMVYPSLY